MAAVNETLIETTGQLPQAGSDIGGFLVNIAPGAGSFLLEMAFLVSLVALIIFSFVGAKACMCKNQK